MHLHHLGLHHHHDTTVLVKALGGYRPESATSKRARLLLLLLHEHLHYFCSGSIRSAAALVQARWSTHLLLARHHFIRMMILLIALRASIRSRALTIHHVIVILLLSQVLLPMSVGTGISVRTGFARAEELAVKRLELHASTPIVLVMMMAIVTRIMISTTSSAVGPVMRRRGTSHMVSCPAHLMLSS